MSALRAIREKKGFSLSQLASRAGIPARVLGEYEEGAQTIPLAHARLLAKALWVQIEELMPPAGAAPVQSARPAVTAESIPAPLPLPIEQSRNQTIAPPQVDPGRPASTPTQRPAYEQAAPVAPPRQSQASPPAQAAREQTVKPSRARSERVSTPPAPLSEGQMQELLHLASRLEVTREQLEERVGKALDTLNRLEAKEWMKRLRAMADELAPSSRARYGRWPATQEDREATYLAKQVNEGASFAFKLFNGESFQGTITDFTPYTITLKSSEAGEEVVLRKLAVAYYRKRNGEAAEEPGAGGEGDTHSHDHARDDAHQPLDRGVDSDRTGQPDTPERDKMDEDRGL